MDIGDIHNNGNGRKSEHVHVYAHIGDSYIKVGGDIDEKGNMIYWVIMFPYPLIEKLWFLMLISINNIVVTSGMCMFIYKLVIQG